MEVSGGEAAVLLSAGTAGGGWWGSGVCRQGGRGPSPGAPAITKAISIPPGKCRATRPVEASPTDQARPGIKASKHSCSICGTRLETRMKTSAACRRDDLKGVSTHIVKAQGVGWGS